MSEPTISVIIPVYNVEKYIGKCIESVLAQSFEDFELICVNDGSTDSSLEVLNHFATKDQRVKVIDKENGGYGHSINRGLEAARGKWVSIIESDDFIASDMFASLIDISVSSSGTDVDIVKSSYWLYFEDEGTGEPYVKMPPIMNNMPSHVFEFNVSTHQGVLYDHPCIWTALYRRDFLEERNIRMSEIPGAGWADNPWMYETLLQAKSIKWTPRPFYYYRQDNPDASSNLRDFRLPFDRLRDLWNILQRLGVDDDRVIVSFYRRTLMYIEIVTVDHDFSEVDPELNALIQEAISRIDPTVLKKMKSRIPKRYITYYEEFMGQPLSKIKAIDAEESPDISIIIPMRNDRVALWPTITNIANQINVSFEVVFVSCSTNDRSREIAEEVCAKDRRFTLVPGEYSSVTSGRNAALLMARGAYVQFIRPGVRYSNQRTLSRAIEQLKAHEDVDVALCVKKVKRATFADDELLDLGPESVPPLVVLVSGNAAELAILPDSAAYGMLFKREFVLQSKSLLPSEDDPAGILMVSRLLPRAQHALVVSNCWMNLRTRLAYEKTSVKKETDLIAGQEGYLKPLWALADASELQDEALTAEACALRLLAKSLQAIGIAHAGESYFHALQELFESRYASYTPANEGVFCNYRDYLRLSQAFGMGYETFLEQEYASTRSNCLGARISRDVAQDKLAVQKKEKAEQAEANKIAKMVRVAYCITQKANTAVGKMSHVVRSAIQKGKNEKRLN